MSKKISIEFEYEFFSSLKDLSMVEQKLIKLSRAAAKKAYAPYSGFKVGAAVLLENDQIVIGNNQENVAYPAGMCAERVAIFSASAQYPEVPILTIAISAFTDKFIFLKPVTPCGSCRQVIAEYEHVHNKPIRLLFTSMQDEVYKVHGATALLPLLFYEQNLKTHP